MIDGDTIEMHGVRIRFHGIDAPESKQNCLAGGKHWPCGELATIALARRISERTVACDERDRDRYGRIVAVCRLVALISMPGWFPAVGRWRTASTRRRM